MITQEDLARYRELRQASIDAEKAVKEAKETLLAGLHDGVEDGSYKLKVETRESRRFSYDGMVDAIGRLQADRIKGLLPVQTSTVVTVTGP